jgi:ubiquinone/menaquinone biosynthesis C-methylase UbiE
MVMNQFTRDRVLSNLKAYDNPTVVRAYTGTNHLFRSECIILSRLRSTFIGKKILEIGVGGGRLTPTLLEISKNYIGIDWSEKMISRCRECFPHVAFMVRDARSLSGFENGSIDLVVFSFNGIDYVGHTGRIEALREIYRVLSDGGVFVFSSHNRRSIVRKPWQLLQPWTNLLRHPRSYLKLYFKLPVFWVNHMRNRRHEIRNDEFSIVNDEAHNYTLLAYYIDIEKQVHQLNKIGFREIEAADFAGNFLSEIDYTTCQDTTIYYICGKGGSEAAG